jgi:hypothetical protein
LATGQDVFLGRLGDSAAASGRRQAASDSTAVGDYERAQYKIVIFAADEDQAGEFLKTLVSKGYTNPGNYVTSPPTNRSVVKHNGAPRALVQELIGFAQEYLTVTLSPGIEPRLSATTIYINLP